MELSFIPMLFTALLTSTSGFDITIVDHLLECARTILGMFNVYPLNYYLVAGIVVIVIGIFVRLKKASK